MNARRIFERSWSEWVFGRSWGEIPPPLRVYGIVVVATLPIDVVRMLTRDSPAWMLPALLVGAIVVTILLLRGSRIVWVLLLVTPFVPPYRLSFSAWDIYTYAFDVFALVVLLLPATRRYVWPPRRSRAVANGDVARGELAAADRPDGWYFLPTDPNWMRYWRGEVGEWTGSVKTPRKLRARAREAAAAAKPLPALDPEHPVVDSPQTSWDPRAHADDSRPRGWYVDPAEPSRMRYWAGEHSGWQGRARTPRKVARRWEAG
ncbi:MAG: hypothetical protein U0R71_13855 [Solirubrobacterales bacterium]